MKENKLLKMAQDFAVCVISMADDLRSSNYRSIADQLLRSGTSISANIAEGNHPQSRADMISKFEIALKEANESENWIEICRKSSLISEEVFRSVHKQLVQIKILLISSIRTLKKNEDQ